MYFSKKRFVPIFLSDADMQKGSATETDQKYIDELKI